MTSLLSRLSLLLPLLALAACDLDADIGSPESPETPETSGSLEVNSLVFEDAQQLSAETSSSDFTSFGDLDSDGHIDMVYISDSSLRWLRGDGEHGMVSGDTAAIDQAVAALAAAGEDDLGFTVGAGSREVYRGTVLPTSGGDRLLVELQVHDNAGTWGVVMGVLSPSDDGAWSASLLAASDSWGGLTPLADIDGDGLSEVIIDMDDTLHIAWGGAAEDTETIGAVTLSSIYPEAWTTTVDGDELGFVYACNWAYGVTEIWSWTPTSGLQLVDDTLYGARAHGAGLQGVASDEVWLMQEEGFQRFVSGSPGSMDFNTHDALTDHWGITTGNFDGSGGLTAVMSGTQALRIDGEDGLEAIPLSVPDFSSYSAAAVDFDGDGLDDILVADGQGISWLENISDE
ncbi:MAG: hypothetical protein P8R54_22160 [Myxococcota bacterium]|nr:hypothetical protein [Myxococcota bacterium]